MKAKNILKTLALPVAVALGMMATSCSSDDNIVNEQQAVAAKHEIPVTVSATRSDEGTRATFNGTSKKLEFEEGDKLFIQGTDATAGTFAGVLSNTSAATGTFSGTIVTENEYTGTSAALFGSATSLTATLLPKDYETEAAGYLTLSGTGASQTLTVAKAKAFVTASSADAAKALAIEQLSLEQATSYSSGFALTPVNAVLNYSISGLANSTDYTPSVSDAATAISGSVTSDASGNAYFAVAFAPDGSKTYTLSITGFSDIAVADRTLTAGKVYKKTATAAAAVPTGAISGKFTINSSGDKVYFSKGNLQYNKSTSTWSFMDHQYSTVETTNQNVGTNYASQGVVSLFGWGTSGETISNYGSAYQPYATSTTSTAYGPTDGTSSLTGTYANGDWGVNIGTGWRTLTGGSGGEWEYLFNTRTVNNGTGSGHSYTLGQKVNDVLGVVLYPDDYTGELYTTAQSDNWSTFESAGCVFLPAAGYRDGTSVYYVGSRGYYWSSTASGADNSCYVYFGSGIVYPANDGSRDYGFSVRLVRDVE